MSAARNENPAPKTVFEPARRMIFCVLALTLAGAAATSPVLADRPNPVGQRDAPPSPVTPAAARPHIKTFQLQQNQSDTQSSTSPEKFGIGVLLTFLAALLASYPLTRPRPGDKCAGQTSAAHLQSIALALTASATLLLAATGASIAYAGAGSPAFDQAALAINAHLCATLLLALGAVLMLAGHLWRKALQLDYTKNPDGAVPFWPAAASTAVLAASGLMLAIPLVFTGPQGQQAAATVHILAAITLAAIAARPILRHFRRRLAGPPNSMSKGYMSKSQRLVQRRAS